MRVNVLGTEYKLLFVSEDDEPIKAWREAGAL